MIIDTFMFRNELDTLEMRLTELQGIADKHVLVESPVTHRGVKKPLFYDANKERFKQWHDKIIHVVTGLPDAADPWVREHYQRDQLWQGIEAELQIADDDVIMICDLDEIVSPVVKEWKGTTAAALAMRTYLFAVDWQVAEPVPPPAVIARVGFIKKLRAEGLGLGNIRDRRSSFELIPDGGWHFSWLGGPTEQREKLHTATCHLEIFNKPEARYITDGTRYRTALNGGGLPVVGVDVDETWPKWIYERRCPDAWFRPKD